MGITEQNVIDYMNALGKVAGIDKSVCTVQLPSIINMAAFGSMAAVFDTQYSIMNVSEEGIMIIAMDAMGKLTPYHIWLNKSDIQKVVCHKKLMGYSLEIQTINGNIKYNLNKIMIGSKFHKKNLNNTVDFIQKNYN